MEEIFWRKRGGQRKVDPIEVATDYLIRGLEARKVARLHGCSIRTVFRLVDEVLHGDSDEARTIQRLCKHSHDREPEAIGA